MSTDSFNGNPGQTSTAESGSSSIKARHSAGRRRVSSVPSGHRREVIVRVVIFVAISATTTLPLQGFLVAVLVLRRPPLPVEFLLALLWMHVLEPFDLGRHAGIYRRQQAAHRTRKWLPALAERFRILGFRLGDTVRQEMSSTSARRQVFRVRKASCFSRNISSALSRTRAVQASVLRR